MRAASESIVHGIVLMRSHRTSAFVPETQPGRIRLPGRLLSNLGARGELLTDAASNSPVSMEGHRRTAAGLILSRLDRDALWTRFSTRGLST